MMIRHWGPDTDIPVHSHPYHEMFYVLEGEIEIGGTIYSAGACIYIEKTLPTGRRARRKAVKCCAMPKRASENNMDAYIDADGLKTFYVKAGSGFPVVLFHGAAPGASAQVNWQLNIEPLAAAGFTVYAYDQAGFGRTENPADLSIEYRVNHAKAFIDALKLDRYHVVGNSVGGYIAARLALEDARVGKFVTTTSGTLAPKGSAESQVLGQKHSEELREYVPSVDNMRALTLGTLFRRELVTEELVRARHEMSIGKNQESAELRRGVKPPRPLFNELANVRTKTLLLWGAQIAAFQWSADPALSNYSQRRVSFVRSMRPLGAVGPSQSVQCLVSEFFRNCAFEGLEGKFIPLSSMLHRPGLRHLYDLEMAGQLYDTLGRLNLSLQHDLVS